MKDSGINLILTGARRADGLWRRRFMTNGALVDSVVNPIASWLKWDVLGYLKTHAIPQPEWNMDVGLDDECICWMHDTYPDDFDRLCRFFPYAPSVIYRRAFYGIMPRRHRRGKAN